MSIATITGKKWPASAVLPALVVFYVLGLRLWFDITVPPMGDEAYYWMWGQHPGWSYLDHPPLDAWLQAGVAAIFGWSPFSLRLLTWLSLGGTLAIFWLWARRLMPETPSIFFWRASAAFLTVPVIALFTLQAFHDHLLVFFCVAALYCFWRFSEEFESGRAGTRYLYLAALALGLAALSKYNGALLGFGFVIYLAFRPKLWTSLRTPHPYLAALLAVAMQFPVIYWNLTDGLASFRFHLLERPSGHWGHPDFVQAALFLIRGIIAAGPFLLIGAVSAIWAMRTPLERSIRALSLSAFAGSTIAVFIVALFTDVLLHWNMVAYVGLGAIGFWALSRAWLFWPHVILTLYLLTGAVWNYSVAPISIPGFVDQGTAANFGWVDVATAVEKLHAERSQAFLAASHYGYAAQLGFALHTSDVTAFSALRSQYDLWWTPAAHIGQDAIVLADQTNKIDFAATQFRSMTKLADVPVIRSGQQVWNFELYLGQGYQPR